MIKKDTRIRILNDEILVLKAEIKELKIIQENLGDMRVKAYAERDELRAERDALLEDNLVLYKFLLKQLKEGKV